MFPAAALDLVWIIFCAILVSTMQAGFCCLESGLVRAKNSINVAIKNLVDFCIACIIFSLVGFRLMFGDSEFWLLGLHIPPASAWDSSDYTFFLFELIFCGTASTIVSGAVAERMTFLGYFIAVIILSAFVYPITGHWVWGGLNFDATQGWLSRLQFHDFAGATVVHSVGAWMAFAAILILGPRIGRFKPVNRNIEGHNLPTAVLGVFLLWFGWFGFNGGSTLTFNDQVPQILVNTAEGGAAGGLAALLTTWLMDKRPKVPIIMNGVIGGLVSVTAGCDLMMPLGAAFSGFIGGILCTLASRLLSYFRVDDAIGVVPAHLVCGIWGTLAVAIFIEPTLWLPDYNFWRKLGIQTLGISVIGLYAFVISYVLLWLINQVLPLRVTTEQERIGLNISEHGASTATQDLIAKMDAHSLAGNFSQLVLVEPETDVAPIANHYNRVLKRMNQITEALQTSQTRLQKILDSPAFPVVISNPSSGIIEFINSRATELFGFSLQETGRYRETSFWQNISDRKNFVKQVQQKKRVDSFEALMIRFNPEETFWCLITGLEINYNDYPCILFSFSDISAQIQREKILRQIADTDSLTGIANRRGFFNQARRLIATTVTDQWAMSILMLDIDYFKQINDVHGHDIGDEVIQSMTKICNSLLRKNDLMGRLGGEEFAVLLCNTRLDDAEKIAKRIRLEVANTTFSSPKETFQAEGVTERLKSMLYKVYGSNAFKVK